MEYFSPQCGHHCLIAARSRRRWGREGPRLGYFVLETALNGWHGPESVRGSVGRRLADRKVTIHAIRRRRSLPSYINLATSATSADCNTCIICYGGRRLI